jgi:hypothetical protein
MHAAVSQVTRGCDAEEDSGIVKKRKGAME